MKNYEPIVVKQDENKTWLLWWSPGESTKFYPIPEKNIQTATDPDPRSLDERLAKYREKMNRVLKGSQELFWAATAKQQRSYF